MSRKGKGFFWSVTWPALVFFGCCLLTAFWVGRPWCCGGSFGEETRRSVHVCPCGPECDCKGACKCLVEKR